MQKVLERIHVGRSGKRIPVVVRFFRTRPDRPCVPPILIFNGYRVFASGTTQEDGIDHLPPTRGEVKESVALHLYSPSGLHDLFSAESYCYILSLNLPGGTDRRQRDRARTADVATEFRLGIFRVRDRYFTACVCKTIMMIVSARTVTTVRQTRLIIEKLTLIHTVIHMNPHCTLVSLISILQFLSHLCLVLLNYLFLFDTLQNSLSSHKCYMFSPPSVHPNSI